MYGQILVKFPSIRFNVSSRILGGVGWGVMNWIELVQYMDRWWALVNALLSLRVLYNAGNFMTNGNRLASEERLCSVEKVRK
jgi:hypothetical protein